MSNKQLLALILVALAVAPSGCAKPEAAVRSPWPYAAMERVVPRPALPSRWPYTGERADNAKAVERRPLCVKIENSAASRPQHGLSAADVVYETITEGGITRFNCIFHSSIPKTIGPVRSARLSDLWIVPQYQGLFFFSGASTSVNARVRAAGLPNLSEDAGVSRPYSRSRERSAPHNLMLDTTKAYEEARRRGMKVTAALKPLLFDRRSLEPSPAVGVIEVPFSQANRVRWVFDEQSGRYLRFNNGVPHRDAANGRQVSADNVVVIWARYTPVSRDKVGSTTYDVKLGGSGRATIFRNGTRVDATWTADRTSPPRFKTADGSIVKLARGQTWFEVLPLDGRIVMR